MLVVILLILLFAIAGLFAGALAVLRMVIQTASKREHDLRLQLEAANNRLLERLGMDIRPPAERPAPVPAQFKGQRVVAPSQVIGQLRKENNIAPPAATQPVKVPDSVGSAFLADASQIVNNHK